VSTRLGNPEEDLLGASMSWWPKTMKSSDRAGQLWTVPTSKIVAEAKNGAEAVDKAVKHKPDVV